jgi:hypothetical protein
MTLIIITPLFHPTSSGQSGWQGQDPNISSPSQPLYQPTLFKGIMAPASTLGGPAYHLHLFIKGPGPG